MFLVVSAVLSACELMEIACVVLLGLVGFVDILVRGVLRCSVF